MKAKIRRFKADCKEANKLRKEEWDFRQLFHAGPNRDEGFELQAATVYEYARESDLIRSLAAEYAALPEPVMNNIEWQCCLALTAAIPDCPPITRNLLWLECIQFWNCILWPKYFPHTPWLSIPKEERQKQVNTWVTAYSRTIFRRHGCEEIQGRHSMTEDSRCFSGDGEHILSWINWRASDNEIANAFKEWVTSNRPSRFPNPHTPKDQQKNKNARLKWLGIMRLLNQQSKKRAGEIWDVDTENVPAYSDHAWPGDTRNLGRERMFVKRELRLIFKSEEFKKVTGAPLIPDDEIPIHWKMVTEGS